MQRARPRLITPVFFVPSGSDTAAMRASLDRCDDLYDLGRGLPAEAVERATMPEAGLPGDLRNALANLDPGESVVVPAASGVTSIVMLCSRQPASEVPPSRDDVRANLLNGKLGYLASAYLEELRANAIIKIE